MYLDITKNRQTTNNYHLRGLGTQARNAQLKLEDELVAFFKEKGLKVYEPDVAAFRTHVQKEYLASKFAKDWPAGMVDKINAIK